MYFRHIRKPSISTSNRPFPRCLVPLFQGESWSIAFHMKMSFHLHADKSVDKTHFHMKSFARSLALKKRQKNNSEMAYLLDLLSLFL